MVYISREGALRAAINDCVTRGIPYDVIRRMCYAKRTVTKHTFNVGFVPYVPNDRMDDVRPMTEAA